MLGVKIHRTKRNEEYIRCCASSFFINLKECQKCDFHAKTYPFNSIRCSIRSLTNKEVDSQ